jgi:hypothetical protein
MTDPLTEINLDDLVTSFGWQEQRLPRALLRGLFHGAAARFARQMLAFDEATGRSGLMEAASQTLRGFVKDVDVCGVENLPASGPALFLSNHPGMTDTLCLFAALARPDLKILALRRPFLQALPHVSERLIFLDDDPAERMAAVRRAAAHLRSGGAVLTFPAGRIEPDPDVYPGACESLETWLDSAGIFLRLVPETRLVPVLVRGVLWDRAVLHPLPRLRPDRESRERLGAAFQLLMQLLFDVKPVTVRIRAARPIDRTETGPDLASIHAVVLERMRGLLQQPAEAGRHLV